MPTPIPMSQPIGYSREITAPSLGANIPTPNNGGFASVMKSVVDDVNANSQQAKALQQQFQAGADIPLHEVSLAMQKSSLSFQTMNAARNKLMQAYQSIINMNI